MSNKSTKKLKVFHGLVNYGTQSGLFARELRKMGYDAISVTYPDAFKRITDIELKHGGNFIQKVIKHTWNYLFRIKCFFKYDIFHFYYGTTLLPRQLDLPFYKFFGKKVVMEYLGYDVQLYEYSIKKYEITNVMFYKTPEESKKSDKKKLARLRSESKYLDKQLVCAPYLSEFVPGSEVLPLAIDLSDYKYSPKSNPTEDIVIMHAPTSRGNKGSLFIINAIDKLINEGYPVKMLLVENVTHNELKKKYIECDIFVDQILGGWYGTASIEAMAIGRPTVCFIRESYFKYIDYGKAIPIINANPLTIYEVLRFLIDNKHLLIEIGKKSRQFVEDIHDSRNVTNRLVEIYNSL
jgi:glycosyltransferase involved in cell wall biosynthesis